MKDYIHIYQLSAYIVYNVFARIFFLQNADDTHLHAHFHSYIDRALREEASIDQFPSRR